MSRATFHISAINPNEAVGGGGCACSPAQATDCVAPYAVFYAQEMEDSLSPHCVVCVACMEVAIKKANEGEVLASGERNPTK
jgi:hypothetical protein